MTDSALVARIVPANKASWDDLEAVLGGARCHGGRCYCQRFKLHGTLWPGDDLEHAQMLREQTDCGHPRSGTTSGLVAYVDGEPAGWCNVEPRTAYPYFRSIPWRNRNEDRSEASIYAVPCFITRSEFRRRGVSYALARAAVDFARERGARALEGYPMIPERGKDVPWGELHVGHVSIFTAAGFTEVSRPSLRRAVMRIDFSRVTFPSAGAREVVDSVCPAARRCRRGNLTGRTAMPKVSKDTASDVREFGPVTDRREEMDGYTIEFVSFGADADLDGPLSALPGGACQCPHWGYVIEGRMRFVFDNHEEVYEAGDAFYQPPGHRPYVDAGTELLQFSPTKELAETERAIVEWMGKQEDAAR